jgi:hemerythrin-like domain-containing protein
MKPIGPLMWEHRLIEEMVRALSTEMMRINQRNTVNTVFIVSAVDFFRTYADRTHHGKEEDILFRDLFKKKLSPEHQKIMNELIAEHLFARKTVGKLLAANKAYLDGDSGSAQDVLTCLKDLADLYPSHIEKEDKHFFYPILDYFSVEEQKTMLEEFREFDRKMIHEKYAQVVEEFTK